MLLSQVHENLYIFIHSWLIKTLFYIKIQKVAKSRKLECTLDALCHLYQTQMLLVASVFAALLLFIFHIFSFVYFSV